jgi:glycerol-3-phosphate dehydrogenase
MVQSEQPDLTERAGLENAMKPASDQFDVIVIGGGIYGLMTALEASLRGQSVALIERDDWGYATTSGWLRILHGGLRYLQTADMPRFFESVNERKWFLQHFPEYIEPLSCVMPLYETHSHAPLVMRAGLALNDILSAYRNSGVANECRLPGGKILGKDAVLEALPFAPADGLRAGACWSDAVVRQPQRLLMALLQWCQSNGTRCFNHSEVVDLQHGDGKVTGVVVRSSRDKGPVSINAPVVINATGHWAPELASQFGVQMPPMPRNSWAWNILFDIPNTATHAAAVSARRADSQVLFMLPWMGKTMLGTGHALIPEGSESEPVPAKLIGEFIGEASAAVPDMGLSESKVARIFQGRLPAMSGNDMELASRPLVVDHGEYGLNGLFSIWGVKYTTARKVAAEVIRQACPSVKNFSPDYARPAGQVNDASIDNEVVKAIESGQPDDALLKALIQSCNADADVRLRDLLLRRCGLGDYPQFASSIAERIAGLMPWDEGRRALEIHEFESEVQKLS